MEKAATIDVVFKIFTQNDSYKAAIEYTIKESVPEGEDPQEYLKKRVSEALGRKIDTENNLLKALPIHNGDE